MRLFFYIPLFILACACSTTDSAPSRVPRAVTWIECCPGVHKMSAVDAETNAAFHAVRIDLRRNGLTLVATHGADGSNNAFLAESTYRFARRTNAVAAVNATPFDYPAGRLSEKRTVAGLYIHNGTVIAPPVKRYAALLFCTDADEGDFIEGAERGFANGAAVPNGDASQNGAAGTKGAKDDADGATTSGGRNDAREDNTSGAADAFGTATRSLHACIIDSQVKEAIPQNTAYAFGGFWTILRDGAIQPFKKKIFDARTAVGISDGGKTIILLAVDNPLPGNTKGASFEDTARIIRSLGANDAIMLDGGSSSALVAEGKQLSTSFLQVSPAVNFGFVFTPKE